MEKPNLEELEALVKELVDPERCWYDHHGYCQTHCLQPRPCPHELAHKLLEIPYK